MKIINSCLVILVLVLFTFLLCFGFTRDAKRRIIVRKRATEGGALSCTEYYSATVTPDLEFDIGRWNGEEFDGTVIVPSHTIGVCAIDVHVGSTSSLSATRFYFCDLHKLDANIESTTRLGQSNTINAGDLVQNTWISANAGLFEFASAITLYPGNTYGALFPPDTDGNLTDDPEIVHGTNYFTIDYDNEAGQDSNQWGRCRLLYSATGLPNNVGDDKDDLLQLRILTEQ